MKDFDIKEELKKLPKKPGVYIMHDKDDSIIYVGKAVNLNNRVRSYFREFIGRGPKIDKMVSLIDYFEYIITDSELEALVLENNLIKEHRPKYNTMLMDDKTYPYIKVTVQDKVPRVMVTRKMQKDKAKYFGPYTSNAAVKEVVDLINKLYGLRTCNKALNGEEKVGRACLNYHIGQCSGPCQLTVSLEEYNIRLKKALEMLNGNYGPVKAMLKEKMTQASENLEFEEAAKYRDLLQNVIMVSEKQKIEDSDLDDKDIIGLATDNEDAVIQVFFIRNGKMVGREHYFIRRGIGEIDEYQEENIDNSEATSKEALAENDDSVIIGSFLKQFYAGTPHIPPTIMLCNKPEDMNTISEYLKSKRGSKVNLVVPKIGQKEKLVTLACKNAELVLTQDKDRIKLEEARTIGAVHQVENWLDIPMITRMEAFDISNTSGFENVASMVVFENGKPKKSDYRKFKIKTVAGPDDYSCMREALIRRFTSRSVETTDEICVELAGEKRYPIKLENVPLILMDGGRGQVNIALEVLKELNLNIPVAGMVKDDHHRTRGIYYNNVEIPIDTHSEGFKLITRIQDEAHRFAIEYHRSLRKKDQVKSVLDDIPGIGPERRLALMKAFASLEDIKNASEEELVEKAGLPKNAARSVREFLNKG